MKNLITLILGFIVFNKVQAQIEKPVKWSYAAKKINAKEALLYLKADIQSRWHIYSVSQQPGGPVKTSIIFNKSKDFTLLGEIIEPKPIQKHEEVFDMDVFYFEKSVVFQQKIKLKGSQTTVKGNVEFMVCTTEQCLPAETIEFSIKVE